MPSLVELARKGLSDVGSVVPDGILAEPALQLPSPAFGPRSPLIVADPHLARIVLVDKSGQFGRDRLMHRLMRRSWGKGLAAAEGDAWHDQRSAAQSFFRSSILETQISSFASATGEVVGDLEDGKAFDLQHFASRIVARILLRVLVDARGSEDPDDLARMLPGYMRAIAGFSLTDLIPMPETAHDLVAGLGRNPSVTFVRGVSDRLAQGRNEAGRDEDLIDRLAGSGPVEANIRGLIPAAMDTTVKGLTWTLFLLARHSDLQDEVVRSADLGLPSRRSAIGRIVQEALRLYPPASFLIRTAINDCELGGHPVRKGQSVAVSIYAMHRHDKYWDDPNRFIPERFAGDMKGSPAYIPFGIGPRSCVAAQFALTEIMVIAAETCRRMKLKPIGPAPSVGLQVTTHPIGPVKAVAKLR